MLSELTDEATQVMYGFNISLKDIQPKTFEKFMQETQAESI